ncbi:hypothetical protein SSBR45G_04620 [Bradyrhizobium sp. SSBR45G]|uniref:hypothetical protein n=1 Tax=unclassified Bradyrhizobium TaxID=2631580 RepID=UPI00234294F5|nr:MULTISPECIES: hypothetical protein [unclassified Bradyrhizobium]GLH75554.1 hypothetical protein SSBR45G_04620 [Bradyrhizobium sp. SSBR45G]GLH82659.1 hypothetical protein SSBR45R_01190 [Bradyrhizobium sp. SSBR45R]
MGITICAKHGRVPFVETCGHVAQQIEQRTAPTGRQLTILGHLFVCDACFEQLGFDRFASLAEMPFEDAIDVDDGRWQLYDSAYDRLEGRTTFCLDCFRDLSPNRDP